MTITNRSLVNDKNKNSNKALKTTPKSGAFALGVRRH